jgi:hypothetical protein
MSLPLVTGMGLAETVASIATPAALFALASYWANLPFEEKRRLVASMGPEMQQQLAFQQYGLSMGENYPTRQSGGMIPLTRDYRMEAGEIVTPEAIASSGRLIPAAERTTGAGAMKQEVHYHFGDINFNNPVIQNANDMRQRALELRRFIEIETARTR